ncbi:hypothetical protein JW964_13135 [candidate division KSB1 bacterium]|nr:hypothetical protein [candidate division KSB1 bacterium]
MLKYLKRIRNGFSYLVTFLLILTGVQYLICPIFRFPVSTPFRGNMWYNPYQDINGNWYKANFHVHSNSWYGMSSGKDNPQDIFRKYKDYGYDIISISDYQSINTHRDSSCVYLPAYEHGYNIGKCHQLVIGATHVEWRDFVLFRNIHHKQRIIKALKRNNAFVVLAHPSWHNAYSMNDVRQLTDFHAIEVFNSYKTSLPLWEQALSGGKPIWAMSNDDSHSMHRNWQTGVCWTMIHAQSNQKENILEALHNGAMIAVKGKKGVNDNSLKKFSIDNNRLTIELDHPANEISFYGQEGVIRKIVRNQKKAELDLILKDTYVRTEIQNEYTTMLLNPIVRFDGESLPIFSATVNRTMTWVQKVAFIFAFYFLILMIGYFQKQKRERLFEIRGREIRYLPRQKLKNERVI